MQAMHNKQSQQNLDATLYQQWRPITLSIVLLIAAFLRLHNLAKLGLEHDEVQNWLIDRSILAGNHAVYFTQAYGHEAGFHYLQAVSVALLGDHAFALRFPAALLGVLTVAVSYRLIKTLTETNAIALFAAVIVATNFFPVFYSRLALRAISLPVLAGLSAIAFWNALHFAPDAPQAPRKRPRLYLLGGLFAGLSSYTYMAARALPIFYLGLIILLALFYRPMFKRNWSGFILFGVTYAVVSTPLIAYLLTNPTAEFRITEISAPLVALQQGDVRPMLSNLWQIFGAAGWSGDPLWRQNVAGMPIFSPLLAIPFYGGLALMLWRRNLSDLFILLWSVCAIVPSALTIDAPSTIRMILLLPVLGVYPAVFMHSLWRLSTVYPQLSTVFHRNSWITCLTIVLIWGIARTTTELFRVWPAHPEVQFVWQTSLSEMAAYLDRDPDDSAVAIMGWSPATLDAPTLELSLQREDLDVRFFGHELPTPMDVVLLPTGQSETARILRPTGREFHPKLEQALSSVVIHREKTAFVEYVTRGRLISTMPVKLSDELVLNNSNLTCRETTCDLLLTWRILAQPTEPRSLFIHLTGEDGIPVWQADGLAVPVQFWQRGDIILKAVTFDSETYADLQIRVGVYNPVTGQRLLTEDGRDYILIEP